MKTGKGMLGLVLALMCALLGTSSAWAQGNPAPTNQGRSSYVMFAVTLYWAGSAPSAGGTSSYRGPLNWADASGTGNKSMSYTFLAYFNSLYTIFRTFSLAWLTLYGLFLGIQFAFGGASEEEIRNFFVGSCVVVGANLLASLYSALFNFQASSMPAEPSVPIQTMVDRPAFYCEVEKSQPQSVAVDWTQAS